VYVECFKRVIGPDENRAIRQALKTYDPSKCVSQKGKAIGKNCKVYASVDESRRATASSGATAVNTLGAAVERSPTIVEHLTATLKLTKQNWKSLIRNEGWLHTTSAQRPLALARAIASIKHPLVLYEGRPALPRSLTTATFKQFQDTFA